MGEGESECDFEEEKENEEETFVGVETDIREGVCWWEFVTSSKMLATRRLQRLWQKQQCFARVAGDLEYIDMQAGVKLESESKEFVSGARRGRVGAHRFFSKFSISCLQSFNMSICPVA